MHTLYIGFNIFWGLCREGKYYSSGRDCSHRMIPKKDPGSAGGRTVGVHTLLGREPNMEGG